MQLLLSLLAVAGCAALVVRLLRSLLGLGINAAEATAVSGHLEVSTRRGDLTAMQEQRAEEEALRRRRRGSLLLVVLWIALLAVPPLAGVARWVYAASALLWLLPRRPVLPRRVGE